MVFSEILHHSSRGLFMTNLSKKHQQVLETKQRLSKALYLLITERHYDKITIYQILDRATISRRTFYRYFNDKADLMDFCLENFVKGYYLQRDNFIVAKKPEDVFLVTLNFMYKNKAFISSLVESGHFALLTENSIKNLLKFTKTLTCHGVLMIP